LKKAIRDKEKEVWGMREEMAEHRKRVRAKKSLVGVG
tara:strand:- start:369 stop:479 length:111 start_codon:yes stop_codon:yes gene_type:complete